MTSCVGQGQYLFTFTLSIVQEERWTWDPVSARWGRRKC